MKWKKGLLIYNQNAGKGKIEKTLGDCLPVLAPNIEEFLLLQTKEQGDAQKLCQEYGEEMDVLFILGGDGTVHECINGLSGLEKRPSVGILPAGTCNDFSRTLNIPQNIRRAAEVMVEGETVLIDVGKAENDYFLNFWGIGLIAETSTNIDPQEKNILGKISYFLSAFRTINESDPFRFKMVYDGKVIEDEAIMILVVNGNFIGTNTLPFPLIKPDDGLLDVIIVKNSNLGVFKEVMEMKRTLSESTDPESGVMYFQAKELQIESDREMDADMDGEIYLQTPAGLSVLRHHLAMLCGPAAINKGQSTAF
ncbi:YegS/Rv2252/BmrU family lipid kinase [Peribacillus cavernae]|uniref:YegS/Rv2252/BmrU family lipid kinase n=1 Tax=Peribacillus cavernae TaxID=1674310 RepID=A0A433HFA5_9BACI|nr:YegS/Rv2252/BmrU family lipid kinase [Peribacillus cavernae]MDQ0221286.1 YegS/Rv2252/BmrU family lipid kinase [Peribacillus cavernae]RUQ26988.1 YegS/Rv2252/BmrU family lipid kinase [Peribacillus cavernae]